MTSPRQLRAADREGTVAGGDGEGRRTRFEKRFTAVVGEFIDDLAGR